MTHKPHVKQGLTTLSTHDASICPRIVVIHHHHHMCSCNTNDNFLPHCSRKNNLQAHRIVTNSKVFLEDECRTHRD